MDFGQKVNQHCQKWRTSSKCTAAFVLCQIPSIATEVLKKNHGFSRYGGRRDFPPYHFPGVPASRNISSTRRNPFSTCSNDNNILLHVFWILESPSFRGCLWWYREGLTAAYSLLTLYPHLFFCSKNLRQDTCSYTKDKHSLLSDTYCLSTMSNPLFCQTFPPWRVFCINSACHVCVTYL